MPRLILLITPRIEKAHAIGAAWDEAGAPGVTYVESHGFHTLRRHKQSVSVLPGVMSMFEIMRNNDENNLMIFSVVKDDDTVERVIAATEDMLGDLSLPHNGVLFVIDVARAVGLRDPG